MAKDQEQFLKTMREFKLYLIEFNKDSIIKTKNYLSNGKVEGNYKKAYKFNQELQD